MPKVLIRAALTGAILCSAGAFAAEPVRQIDIYVQPYYEAPATPGAAPKVAVGESYSRLLASTRKEDIIAARDKLVASPSLVTPMTMMVLAIRLYDVGLRDDAVFWFYAAKDRYLTLADVVDINAAGLAQVDDAIRSFAALAGPVINGYAFCDPASQTAIEYRAVDWTEQNPYGILFMEKVPARPGDRRENLAQSIDRLKAAAVEARQYLQDPIHRAEFMATRASNDMDAQFCWR